MEGDCSDRRRAGASLKAERTEQANLSCSQAIPFADSTFSHVFTNFGVQLFPDPDLAVSGTFSPLASLLSLTLYPESSRVLRSGGTLGFTSWTSPGWLPLVQRADPSYVPPSLFTSTWATPSALSSSLASLGFHSILVTEKRFKTKHARAKEWVERMGMTVPLYAGEVGQKVRELLEKEQGMGEITLEWVAWVVTAIKA